MDRLGTARGWVCALLFVQSTDVHAQQHVNTSVFSIIGCSPLIPLTFPQRNFRLLHSSHSGVTCHTYSRCEAACLCSEGGKREDDNGQA